MLSYFKIHAGVLFFCCQLAGHSFSAGPSRSVLYRALFGNSCPAVRGYPIICRGDAVAFLRATPSSQGIDSVRPHSFDRCSYSRRRILPIARLIGTSIASAISAICIHALALVHNCHFPGSASSHRLPLVAVSHFSLHSLSVFLRSCCVLLLMCSAVRPMYCTHAR